ncbi:unnamed protein product [Prunus armeniaca]|uniref:Uncharacterized protein n=1 Tax=Prunus armeniaca TaxID=36596 RepID=A0A6J5TV84_PRUAR|nr:hypothetical protein GBA52_000589 [Prunus armeniaca]CAB4267294.1 unnamed protein product [Prunus armeniaca]
MVEKTKDPKKCSITEEDTATLLQRYTATTVLALLQEVAHWPAAKIDWIRLVAKTSTGISNAREYQMLWRHLAYREALVDKFDNGSQPLDDDSDLEYELEAFPAVCGEASTEAAACVKVLIASGLPSDSSHRNGTMVEAPLTINIPNGQPSRTHENSEPTCSMQGKNITVPVSVKKQPLPAATTSSVATADGGDANGSASNSMAPRKKRKKWSEAEDFELIAAVQKCGEGNWANILRADFKGDRTAGQLSQRWAIIKKRNQELNLRGNSSGKLSEAQLAARHSLSVALNMPNLTAKTIGTAGTNAHNKFARKVATSNSVLTTGAKAEPQSQQDLKPTKKPYQMELLGSTTKSRVTSKNTLTKPNCNDDDIVRAIAVAAGARIASPSDAASLLKAAQAKNAVHIMPTGGSSIQSSLPGGMSTHSEPHPNLHMRTGLAGITLSTPPPTDVTPSAVHPGSSKALPLMSQHTPTNGTLLSKQIKGVSCSLDAKLPSKQEVRTEEGSVIAELGCTPIVLAQDEAVISRNGQNEQVKDDKVDSPNQKAELKILSSNAENPVSSLNIERDETHHKAVISVQGEQRQSAKYNEVVCSLIGGGDPSAVYSSEKPSTTEKQTDLLGTVTDGCNGKHVLSKEEAGIKINGEHEG